MHIDREALLRKIESEPDLPCEAGALHPEAPVPALIRTLTPRSSDLEIIAVIEKVERHDPSHRDVLRMAVCDFTGIDPAIYHRLRDGAGR